MKPIITLGEETKQALERGMSLTLFRDVHKSGDDCYTAYMDKAGTATGTTPEDALANLEEKLQQTTARL